MRPRLLPRLLVTGCALLAGPVLALDWSLRADEVVVAGVELERIEVGRGADGSVRGTLVSIELPGVGPWGDLRFDCGPSRSPCASAALQRLADGDASTALGTLSRDGGSVTVSGEAGRIDYVPDADGARLAIEALDLVAWLGATRWTAPLQDGRLDGRVALEGAALDFALEVRAVAFDTPDGAYAGADLAGAATGRVSAEQARIDLRWDAGEALLGPVYLPSPPTPVELELRRTAAGAGRSDGSVTLRIDGILQGSASGPMPTDGAVALPESLAFDFEVLDLAAAWPLGPDSLAASAGWPGLSVAGTARGAGGLAGGRIDRLDLALEGLALADPAGRVAVEGGSVTVLREAGLDRIAVAIDAASVYRLPVGATALSLTGVEDRLELVAPARIPVLDGALRLERLQIDRSAPGRPAIDLDAALEPLDLAGLTERLDWPRFGGSLSGRFPGVRLDGEALRVAGGLDIDLFDGQARIEGLAIERPFGPLPALSGSLSLERLDLAPLTSAFEFGAMQGSLSGYLRDLRLLDWQPVAFDAWLYTPRDSRRPRRISQRAVDQIASLGGGGAAALSAPLLSMFDDFGYTQVGLGCRLAGNVCSMRGLDERPTGGYTIVEGRGLPRLDVVGFRRQVDWPVLLAQLRAATRGDAPRVGSARLPTRSAAGDLLHFATFSERSTPAAQTGRSTPIQENIRWPGTASSGWSPRWSAAWPPPASRSMSISPKPLPSRPPIGSSGMTFIICA